MALSIWPISTYNARGLMLPLVSGRLIQESKGFRRHVSVAVPETLIKGTAVVLTVPFIRVTSMESGL